MRISLIRSTQSSTPHENCNLCALLKRFDNVNATDNKFTVILHLHVLEMQAILLNLIIM